MAYRSCFGEGSQWLEILEFSLQERRGLRCALCSCPPVMGEDEKGAGADRWWSCSWAGKHWNALHVGARRHRQYPQTTIDMPPSNMIIVVIICLVLFWSAFFSRFSNLAVLTWQTVSDTHQVHNEKYWRKEYSTCYVSAAQAKQQTDSNSRCWQQNPVKGPQQEMYIVRSIQRTSKQPTFFFFLLGLLFNAFKGSMGFTG